MARPPPAGPTPGWLPPPGPTRQRILPCRSPQLPQCPRRKALPPTCPPKPARMPPDPATCAPTLLHQPRAQAGNASFKEKSWRGARPDHDQASYIPTDIFWPFRSVAIAFREKIFFRQMIWARGGGASSPLRRPGFQRPDTLSPRAGGSALKPVGPSPRRETRAWRPKARPGYPGRQGNLPVSQARGGEQIRRVESLRFSNPNPNPRQSPMFFFLFPARGEQSHHVCDLRTPRLPCGLISPPSRPGYPGDAPHSEGSSAPRMHARVTRGPTS
jgi:hypothetical protein